jgi:two-component system, cell cycle sensor histidine kinase and response regulator CckA
MPTILVVDDEPAVRLLACRILREAGYPRIEAESGLAALGLLQGGGRPDVMVVDIRLPDMSGLDLVRLARTIQPAVPALYISGYPEPVIEEHQQRTLLRAFLAKPFAAEQLIGAVRQLLPVGQPA